MELHDLLVLSAFVLPLVALGASLIKLSRWAARRHHERTERGEMLDDREGWQALVGGRYKDYANHMFFDQLPGAWRQAGTVLAIAVIVVVSGVLVLVAIALLAVALR